MLESKYKTSYFIIAFLVICAVIYARGKPVNSEENVPLHKEFVSCTSEQSNGVPEITCPQLKEADDYALSIDANEFRSNKEIEVKVYRTSCPISSESSLPRWYQLEAYWSQDNSSDEEVTSSLAAGNLKPLSSYRTDFYQCENATKVLFYPCEAVRYDFPGRHIWKAPHVSDFLLGSVCFRLTLLEENSTICETIEKCIPYVNDSSTTELFNIQDFEDYEDYEDYDEDDDIIIELDSEEEEYPEEEYQEEDVSEETEDVLNEETDLSPGCLSHQKHRKSINSTWIPQCDCKGYYRSVQCAVESSQKSLTCWCSTAYGSRMSSSIVVDCTNDYSVFELSCTFSFLTDTVQH